MVPRWWQNYSNEVAFGTVTHKVIFISQCFSLRAAVTAWMINVWHGAKRFLTNRAMAHMSSNSIFFFFYSLLTTGTCGKQALWAGETFKGLPVLRQNINKHAVHHWPDFPLIAFTAPPRLFTMGTVLGPIWGQFFWQRRSGRVQLSLPVKIFWPCRIRILLLLELSSSPITSPWLLARPS